MNEPIRILQMTASLYSGGSQNMIVNIYKNIDRSKVQFDFIVDHPEYMDLKETVEKLGSKIYIMPKFKIINYFEVKKAWNIFFSEHPEYKIIHSHSRSYAAIYLRVAKKYGIKTIIHSHNTSNGKGLLAKVKDIIQKEVRNIADYYFACSLNAGKWLFGERIIKQDNFNIINNAIDINQYRFNNDIRNKYRKLFNLNGKVYIQVGEFNDQKNHKFTIELFSKIVNKEPMSRLILVGDGFYFNEIKKMINELRINGNVLMLGKRSDVSSLLMASDVYLMPSNFEGLSLAAIEAQASGIKCIFSDRISFDVNITNKCLFLPLNIDVWMNNCLNINITRDDNIELIKKAGYDVKNTAEWLQDFYLDIINK